MSVKKLRFALFGNEYQAKKSVAVQRIISFLKERGAEVYIDRPYYDFLSKEGAEELWHTGVFDDYNFDVDFVISMGGDGTFLKAASKVGAKGTPILGVNMGRLGFLADVLPGEIYEVEMELRLPRGHHNSRILDLLIDFDNVTMINIE